MGGIKTIKLPKYFRKSEKLLVWSVNQATEKPTQFSSENRHKMTSFCALHDIASMPKTTEDNSSA